RAVARGDDEALFALPGALRDRAAEDVLDTAQIAASATGSAAGREVLSYEGPFGVGYLVAVLHERDEQPDERAPSLAVKRGDQSLAAQVLVDVAEDALRAHLGGDGPRAFDTRAADALPCAGVFVTWRKADGALRGCVGRMTIDAPVSR